MADPVVLVDGLRILLDNNRHIINIDGDELTLDLNNKDTDMSLDHNYVLTNVDGNIIDLNRPNDNIAIILSCGSTIIPKDELMQKIAGTNVGGFRCVVTDSSGHIVHADVARILAGKEIVGITTQAGAVGSLVTIGITGDEIIESSWNWDTDKSIYATEYGHLTQDIPINDYSIMVAIPLTSTSIRIRIEPAIFF